MNLAANQYKYASLDSENLIKISRNE